MPCPSRGHGFFLPRRCISYTRILFIVNDDLDLAQILDADGLHLGQEDLPLSEVRPFLQDKIIGVSTHNLEQVRQAITAGADYIGLGPVYTTSTKENPDPVVGLEMLSTVVKLCPLPVVAIGGITRRNVPDVISSGARSAAVVTDILLAEDVEDAARKLKRELAKFKP